MSIRTVQRRKAELLNVVVPGGDSNVADADARLNAGGGVYEGIPEDELEEGLRRTSSRLWNGSSKRQQSTMIQTIERVD